MNLRKLILTVLSLYFVVVSCKDDDDTPEFVPIPERDRQEVYDENLIEIETYLTTHFFNYEDFDSTDPYSLANDSYTVVFDTISGDNSTKIPIIDFLNVMDFPKLTSKTVIQDGIDYKLYYLMVREGLGKPINALDSAAVLYNGTLPEGNLFDSAVTIGGGQPFNLTGVGNIGGVVEGFKEGILQFKTSTGNTIDPDGTVTYNDHGIGAVFIPSGLGYFSTPPNGSTIPQYSPLIFTLKPVSRSNTDFDLDGVPSHIEHPDGDFTDANDDTDSDELVNFIDNDDDGDGVLTRDEVQKKSYTEDNSMNVFMSRAEAQAFFDANAETDEIFISIIYQNDMTYVLNTLIVPKTSVNGEMLPNYLNANVTTVL